MKSGLNEQGCVEAEKVRAEADEIRANKLELAKLHSSWHNYNDGSDDSNNRQTSFTVNFASHHVLEFDDHNVEAIFSCFDKVVEAEKWPKD